MWAFFIKSNLQLEVESTSDYDVELLMIIQVYKSIKHSDDATSGEWYVRSFAMMSNYVDIDFFYS